jgi:hypothetical protein
VNAAAREPSQGEREGGEARLRGCLNRKHPGVFIARGTSGGTYQVLGRGLPTAPVFTMELKPKASIAEPDKLVVATQGRGVWTYTFKDPAKKT